jgi:hypothetical protein
MTLADIEKYLDQGLKLVQQVAPLAALGGPAAGAWGAVVANVAGTADGLLVAVESDAAIIATGDVTKIKALQAQLQAENAKLAAQIAAS